MGRFLFKLADATLYHGANKPFEELDPEKVKPLDDAEELGGLHLGTPEQASAVALTPANRPRKFDPDKAKVAPEYSRVYPVEVNLLSPLRMPDLGMWRFEDVKDALKDRGINALTTFEPGEVYTPEQ